MLRLSSLVSFASALLTRLPFARRSGQRAARAMPALPLKARLRAIIGDAGMLTGAGLVLLVAFGVVAGNPGRTVPATMLSFASSHGSVTDIAQGETGAMRLAIDPSFAPYLEPGPYGPLPRIAADGTKPAWRFARRPSSSGAATVVSVIVSGLGLNLQETRDAILRLPPAITLAFSPYARDLGSFTELAREHGHEYFLEVPLEPFDYPQSDPGPLVLLVDAPQSSNLDRLHRTLAECVGYAGILVTGRARFATNEAVLMPIVTEAKARGLMILDDGRAPVSLIPKVTRQVGALGGVVDRRLDDRPSADGIALALIEFERLAVEQGRAIGASDLFPIAVDRIASWTDTLKGKGLVLEPVSVQILPDDSPQPQSKKS
jgi:uncharacterized protein